MSSLAQYRSVIVHDSAEQEIPWSANIIEGTQRFFVSSVAQKIAAITAGIGIGYLPKRLIEQYIGSGQLVEVKLTEQRPCQYLFIAWKITNKGKGLQRLTSLLLQP